MKTQEYLKNNSLEKLKEEFCINQTFHETLPLVVLNYDQLDSKPRNHPIVMECRGLILQTTDFSLVARSFPRFFNYGEFKDDFDFSDFSAETKEDGSLIILFCYNDEWIVATKGSFGKGKINRTEYTWEEIVGSLVDKSNLDKRITYICEICCEYNKIVRCYKTPTLYLLTAFNKELELKPEEVDKLAGSIFPRPTRLKFNSIEEVQKFLKEKETFDPTFEGFVLRDKNNNRLKIKTLTYLALHQLRGNGEYNEKHILPFILNGDAEELLLYFPELKEKYEQMKEKVEKEFCILKELWEETQNIESQKEFAQKIVKKTKFSSVLFSLRKNGKYENFEELIKLWRNNEDSILKLLF